MDNQTDLHHFLNGEMSTDMKIIQKMLERWIEIDRKPVLATAYLSSEKLYAQISSSTETISIKFMITNVGFLIKNVPNAIKKSEEYFLN